jgi:hypothetical protein
MNPFRGSRKQAEKLRPKSKFLPWDAEQFRMDIDTSAVSRVLPPPNNEPFMTIVRHGFPPRICTKSLPGFDGKCNYCHYHQEAKDRNDDKAASAIYPKISHLVELVDFRYFHFGENDQGKSVAWVCSSDKPDPKRSTCSYCRKGGAVSKRIFGGHKVWELGKMHFLQLETVAKAMSYDCIQGEGDEVCGQEVFTEAYSCAGCKEELITNADLTSMNDEDVHKIINDELECSKCGHVDYPDEVVICNSEAHEPVRGGVFDKNLGITRAGEVQRDRNGKERKSSVLNFDRRFPYQHVMDALAEYGFNEAEMEKILEPWDLVQRYRPERLGADTFDNAELYVSAVLKKQAEYLKRPNAYTDTGGGDSGGRSLPFRRR